MSFGTKNLNENPQNSSKKSQTSLDAFLEKIKRKSEDKVLFHDNFEIFRRSSMNTRSVSSLNNISQSSIKNNFKVIKEVAIRSKITNENDPKNVKRNWDSSSDEEPISIFQTSVKKIKVDDSLSPNDKGVKGVLNVLRKSICKEKKLTKSSKNSSNICGLDLSTKCQRENFFKRRNHTEIEINSIPVTEKNKFDIFLKKIIENNKSYRIVPDDEGTSSTIKTSTNIANIKKCSSDVDTIDVSKLSKNIRNIENNQKRGNLSEVEINNNDEQNKLFNSNSLHFENILKSLKSIKSEYENEKIKSNIGLNTSKQEMLQICRTDLMENTDHINPQKQNVTQSNILNKTIQCDMFPDKQLTFENVLSTFKLSEIAKIQESSKQEGKKPDTISENTKKCIKKNSNLETNKKISIDTSETNIEQILNDSTVMRDILNTRDTTSKFHNLKNVQTKCDNDQRIDSFKKFDENINSLKLMNSFPNECTQNRSEKDAILHLHQPKIKFISRNNSSSDIESHNPQASEKSYSGITTKNLSESSSMSKHNGHLDSDNILSEKELSQNRLINNTCQIRNTSENLLLKDEKLNLILTEEYDKYKKREEVKNHLTHSEKITKIEKFIKQSKLKKDSSLGAEMHYTKRYRKGKLNIYRLKKLKKPANYLPEEDLSIENVLKGLTQTFIEPESKLNRSKSCSSVSTSSSYVTYETRSETLSTGSQELSTSQQKLRTGLNDLLKDKALFCKNEEKVIKQCDKSEIKRKIQNIFLQVFDDLTNGKNPTLKFRRQCLKNCTFKDERLQYKTENIAVTVINSNSQKSQNRFKLILYILKKVQTLLETNTKLTKRELFYQMKDMISNQPIMDRMINAVSCLLDVGMWALNIVAQKGLVFGDLKILLSNGETINCKVPGTLIPQDIEEIIEFQSTAYFILVIEKESAFHKLIEEDLQSKLTRPFIMITGKGFPDLNTQLFLRKLWIVMSIPVFIFVDADPDGVQIMLNYRFGSLNNAHVSHHLAIPNARWLGIFPSEIKDFDVITQPLTGRELKLVHQLLKLPYVVKNPAIALELNVMLKNQCKAGIEAFMKSQIFLSQVYFPIKFYVHKFI